MPPGAATSADDKPLKDPSLLCTKAFINGEWVDAASGKTFEVIDPSNGNVIIELPECDPSDVERAIQAAAAAFETFKKTPARTRARMLRKWSDLMLDNIEDLAVIMTLENGKSLADSRGEITYAASFLEWFAGESERTYGQTIPAFNPNSRILTIKQPIGVCGVLTPWNFPCAMITRKVGAALGAGCTVVAKPAGETPLSALALGVLGTRAGVPKGVFNVITTQKNLADVGAAICASPIVRKVSFTGSTRVGKLLMSQCSETLKKLSFELGGNSPFIVFEDADLEKAVDALMVAKFRNSGQTCVCANRIYVQEGVYDKVIQMLKERMQKLKVGGGFEEGVTIGPLTVENGIKKAETHVKDAISNGAALIMGGKALNRPGTFFAPTILSNFPPSSILYSEESFAPIAALTPFHTLSTLLPLANTPSVGLGAFICTRDISLVWRVAEALEVGMVGVNTGLLSACESPFGGVKGSGFGREGGSGGIEEYLVVKSLVMDVS
ncbi:succinate-semialdehyde dehydrogenase [Saitoella complicata NRRL Y-17804]|uniref:Succinate-semialdehyde dehydrogenase, mitochondrial n=1 Tax=Saitoella complicata (strain BCRC 22490 / CBS 7301 / JCM 7358 / NBRC 10748 / NRRL Y-17804) TaxID=698492 RepID=A0A0E9NSV4_SAICN|nr:succinate-semialdehyde dehydrogenase [Saitoella complicata NRRL Y-17804]ODQ53296.1 succinate-semialdehyde dehydrogenase [Saitoella complicata NRRL Y-17804]GAO52833.1 hypothetical protein G7K_6899-t1 [Saitoella complicata NRRL Y-17804]